MLEILSRSIARAGGIEVPADVRIVPVTGKSRGGLFRAIAARFRRWHDRRSTYLALAALSDHHLKDIGLHRGMLERAADDLTDIRFANDNRLSGVVAANDNTAPDQSCVECA